MMNDNEVVHQLGPATTCYVDRDGIIVKTNSRFDGMKPEQFVGVKLADFMLEPSRSEYLQLLARAIHYGEVGSFTNVIESDSGLSHWQVRICPWREDGRIIGAIMIGNQMPD